MTSRVSLSSAVKTDPEGFSRLARLHHDLDAQVDSDLQVDFSRVGWFDSHLAAPLNIVIRHAQARRKQVKYVGLGERLQRVLQRMGFFNNLSGELVASDDRFDHRIIPLAYFTLRDAVQFARYTKRHLDRREMPRMTKALQLKFFEGVDELFGNAALHSNSELGVTVGGHYSASDQVLNFSVSDGGQTIPGSVKRRFPNLPSLSAHEAIDWAMMPFNTTRQGDIPGGLGSKVLREFVELNGGRLIIASGEGYWCQDGNRVTKVRLALPFPGTAVVLEINTSDKRLYDLAAPPDPRNIW